MNIRLQSDVRRFACSLCDYTCSVKSHLTNHTRAHTGEKPFSCNVCEYKCSVKSALTKHTRTHTGDVCDVCDHTYSQKSHLVLHMRTHTGEKPHTCNICQYKFSNKSNLTQHMKTHNTVPMWFVWSQTSGSEGELSIINSYTLLWRPITIYIVEFGYHFGETV